MARVRLGVGYEELRRMTLRQLFVFVDESRKLDRERESTVEVMLGQLIAAVVNTSMRAPAEPVMARDYMPSARAVKRKKKRYASSTEIRAWMQAWGR